LTGVTAVAGANEFAVNEAGTSKKASADQIAGYINPTYINGLNLLWVGDDAITITAGSAYVNGEILTLASNEALTSLSLSAATWYYVYLYDNTGADIELSTTVPAFYNGTAAQKNGDATRRYIGCFLTRGADEIMKFVSTAAPGYFESSFYEESNATPFRVLAAGANAAIQTLSVSSVCPDVVFSHLQIALTLDLAATGDFTAGVSAEMDDGIATFKMTSAEMQLRFFNSAASSRFVFLPPGWIKLNARQVKWQTNQVAGTNSLYIDVKGFRTYR
jgi:hypothetical protein